MHKSVLEVPSILVLQSPFALQSGHTWELKHRNVRVYCRLLALARPSLAMVVRQQFCVISSEVNALHYIQNDDEHW